MKIAAMVLVCAVVGGRVAFAETTTRPATQAATQQGVTSEKLEPDGDGNWSLWLGMTLEEARKVSIASAHEGVVKSTDAYKPTLVSDEGGRQVYAVDVWNGKEKATWTLTVEGGKVVRMRKPTDN